MAQTQVPSGSSIANKEFSVALFAQTLRSPTILNNMTGPAPKLSEATRKLKNQSDPGMPCIRVTDLSKTAGDLVSVDAINLVHGKPIMGDRNAEGKGVGLSFSTQEIKIDQSTFVVDVGGRMAQQRTKHNLRLLGLAELGGYFPRLESQQCLVHLAGARGEQNGPDWAVPLANDPDFAEIMINTVKAPTFNRHFVCDHTGSQTGLIQGGQQIPNLTVDCFLKLEHIDLIRTIIDDLSFKPQPVKIMDDPAKDSDPLYVLLVPPLSYHHLITSTSAGNLRTFQQNAWQRASYGSKHPLFKGEAGIWNNILVKKIEYSIRWEADGSGNIAYNDSLTDTAESGSAAIPTITNGVVERCLLVGAQALATCYGKNQSSDYYYSWKERFYNFDRNLEIAGMMMNGKDKLRFSPKDESGTPIPTDHGVFAMDFAAIKPHT